MCQPRAYSYMSGGAGKGWIRRQVGKRSGCFLASAVPLNIDLDVMLSVLAHTTCAALRRRLPGYATATSDTLQRRFLNTGGIILNRGTEIVIRLEPAHLLTHPAPGPPARNNLRALAGRRAPSARSSR